MSRISHSLLAGITIACLAVLLNGCTVKAVGDPERPITIKAHVTLDIKGLKNTATDIEDYVSGKKPADSLPVEEGGDS